MYDDEMYDDTPDTYADTEEPMDEWLSCGCDTPDCIVPDAHYRSECETIADAEAYYDAMESED